MSPYKVIEDFEQALAEYTGAPYVVCVSSCTSALHLALEWCKCNMPPVGALWCKRHRLAVGDISIPRHTYIGVAQSIRNAGYGISFRDEDWIGRYYLDPFPIIDSAKHFTSGMYLRGTIMAVSFQASKTLGLEMGGALLLDDPTAYEWFKQARFDGRVFRSEEGKEIYGWHYPMLPSIAAQGLLKLYSLPRYNPPQPRDNYPDLSKLEIFK